jgi:hypothetical protein
MNVFWSLKAMKSYDQVRAYLTSELGKASVQKFMNEVVKLSFDFIKID